MPNIFQKTQIVNGPKTAVFHFYIRADGIEGEINRIIIDPAVDFAADTIAGQPVSLAIHALSWAASSAKGSSFAGLLQFDGVNPYNVVALSPTANMANLDFQDLGGLKDRSDFGGNGKLKLTTFEFLLNNMQAHLVLKVKKYYKPLSLNAFGTIGAAQGTAL